MPHGTFARFVRSGHRTGQTLEVKALRNRQDPSAIAENSACDHDGSPIPVPVCAGCAHALGDR
jgi:hypothetical protein